MTGIDIGGSIHFSDVREAEAAAGINVSDTLNDLNEIFKEDR